MAYGVDQFGKPIGGGYATAPENCGPGYHWDNQTGACEPDATSGNQPPARPSGSTGPSSGPQPGHSCPAGMQWTDVNGQWVCQTPQNGKSACSAPQPQAACPPGMEWNCVNGHWNCSNVQAPPPSQTNQQDPPPSGGGGGSRTFSGGDPYSWVASQAGSMPPTYASLVELRDALVAAGVNAYFPANAAGPNGSRDKLVINGSMYDFIRNVDGPGAAWQFGSPIGSGSGGGGEAAPMDFLMATGTPSIMSSLGLSSGAPQAQYTPNLNAPPAYRPTAPPPTYTPSSLPPSAFQPNLGDVPDVYRIQDAPRAYHLEDRAPDAYRPTGTAPLAYQPTAAPTPFSPNLGSAPAPYEAEQSNLGPVPTFTPEQYDVPDELRGEMEALLLRMLRDPALSDDVTAQMKERQKSGLLTMEDQLRQMLTQDAASRGVAGGGNLEGLLADTMGRTRGDISKAYRDIDIERALTERSDQEKAVLAAQNWQQQLLNEFLALENERFRGFTTERDAQDETFDRWLSEEELQRGAASDRFANWLGTQNLGLSASDLAGRQWATEQNVGMSAADQDIRRYFSEEELKQVASDQLFRNWLNEQNLLLAGKGQEADIWETAQGLGLQRSAQQMQNWLGRNQIGLAAGDQALQSWQAGESANQFASSQALQSWLNQNQLGFQSQDQEFRNWSAVNQLMTQSDQQAFDRWLSTQGLSLQQMAMQQSESQFTRNLQLLWAKFLAGGE